jgi:hypothetical protein
LVLTIVLAAIAVTVVLIVLYTEGGSGEAGAAISSSTGVAGVRRLPHGERSRTRLGSPATRSILREEG